MEGEYVQGGESVEVTVVEGDSVTVLCRANKMQTSMHPVWKLVNTDIPGFANSKYDKKKYLIPNHTWYFSMPQYPNCIGLLYCITRH